MNRHHSPRLTIIVCLYLVTFFSTACQIISGTPPAIPTPTPISAQDSQKLLEEWGLLQLIRFYGGYISDSAGTITDISGDISIDLAFENPPRATLVDANGEKFFKFDIRMPTGSSVATVIFVTPEAEGGQVRIPSFTPKWADSEDPKTRYFRASSFRDYEGTYDFKIGLTKKGGVVDLNVFYDGSEHHIYGEVELFGVKFKNTSSESLVFKVSGDKYVYVNGEGTATTGDGSVVEFGK